MFFTIRDLPSIKQTPSFATTFFPKIENVRIRSEQGTPQGRKEEHHASTHDGHVVEPISSLVDPLQTLAPQTRLDLQPTIYTPLAILGLGDRETQNT
jgi:hypothetical protein